ncbi:MAG: O-antigen ligase family protein [Candidatus Cloacimonadaceae bacterium]
MTEAIPHLKYIFFFITLFLGVPLGCYLANRYPKVERFIFIMMIFFTVRMEDINFVSRETFRLSSRGFEVGMVDICVLILLYFTIKNRGYFRLKLPPGSWLYFLYFAFSALSMVNSIEPLFSWFELWKMLRMYVFFFTVYNYLNSFVKVDYLLPALAITNIYIFIEVIYQKYFLGKFQSYGPFPHQNSLVMYSIILGSIFLAYVMNAEYFSRRNLAFWLLMFFMATVNIVATLSRAGLVLYAVSLAIVLALSFLSHINSRKVTITLILFFLGIAFMAKAWNSIQERFVTAPMESAEVRKDLAYAAVNMAEAKTLGVGLNNFGVAINPPYEYGSHIPMIDPEDEEEQNGLVETIYLMIAAECGWHTMVVFIIFIFYYYFMSVANFFNYQNNPYQFIPIAFTGSLLAIYLESTLEWVLKQTNNFYQLMLVFALISALQRMYKIHRSTQEAEDRASRLQVQTHG